MASSTLILHKRSRTHPRISLDKSFHDLARIKIHPNLYAFLVETSINLGWSPLPMYRSRWDFVWPVKLRVFLESYSWGMSPVFFLVKKPYKMVNLYSSPEGKSMSPLKYHLLMKQIYFTSSLEAFYFLKEQPLEWTLVSRGLK